MQLQITMLDVRRFTVNSESRMFICEASDWKGTNLLQPLYDDAADAGFGLYNPRTRAKTRWFFAEDEHDAEGELLCSIYKPCSETLRLFPNLTGWEIHILND